MNSYTKSIASCFEGVHVMCTVGTPPNVTHLHYDSRKVEKESAFFALRGLHTQGNDFIDDAISKGALAIIYEGNLTLPFKDNIFYVQVENVREAMARIARNFYEKPDLSLRIIGVTGTEGKSSTTAFLASLLNLLKCKTGFLSTVSYSYGTDIFPNPEHQTTPESTQVFAALSRMRDAGCKCAVLETSSHGLSARTARLFGLEFDAGICLNIRQEHLEFHGSIECYRNDKANLFRKLKANNPSSFAIINEDDEHAAFLKNVIKTPIFSFTHNSKTWNDLSCNISPSHSFFLIEEVKDDEGLSFNLSYRKNETMQRVVVSACKLHGSYNADNITAVAIAASQLLNLAIEDVLSSIQNIQPIKGRMMKIDEGQDFEVIIDYAHTPSSFLTIFPPMKEKAKLEGGRIIALFGSGGERDIVKRAEQGRIASIYCDIIILADEDPRGEDRMKLLEMIAEGVKGKIRGESLFLIPKREDAIEKAFSIAKKGDIVLLLGKGHESSIIFSDHVQPYDEEDVARQALKAHAKHFSIR